MKKKIIEEVLNKKLTYLNVEALRELIIEVDRCSNVEGIIVETGCALGGSSICIASVKKSKRLYVYDSFGMIPAPSGRDGEDAHQRYDTIFKGESKGIDGSEYYGYQKNLYEKVESNFRSILNIDNLNEKGIYLVRGFYEDTLHINEKISFAHIDCDWYESVKISLQEIVPNLSVNGVIVIDDYFTWSGCKTAVDEYFINNKEKFEFSKKSRLHITRKS